MQSEILKDNASLSNRVQVLEGLVSLQQKKIDTLYSTVKVLSHFVPQVYEKFKLEYSEICNEESQISITDTGGDNQ